MTVKGVWLPIITPFYNGRVDYQSYEELINHFIPKGISGLISLGTTGESPTISNGEFERIIDRTVQITKNRVPVYVGLGGNYTDHVLQKIKMVEKYGIDGILSVCPYYNRPNQRGIKEHFVKISEATDLNIIIYNIPYRTGVNLENDTLITLAELKNIVGVKDSCGSIKQSLELLIHKPKNFSVLTGEDILFYTTLVNGGDGGILAAAHLKTENFCNLYSLVQDNDHRSALSLWKGLESHIPLLFAEPNPAPVKYCLKQLSLIQSDEVRLPLLPVSDGLKLRLNRAVGC
jgi:4-hydroxy-tetrahydrodipicolinate synthase